MKVSKYCLGMMKYYSDREIKSNRFKKEDHTTKEDIMLINVILKKKLDEPFTLQWFDEDFLSAHNALGNQYGFHYHFD